ncbi:MAG: hypothetical protein SO182_03365 [Paludibacteraceae bacterium]|nr:hypothetical protein [Paludibacteraceae bacterium]
MIDERLELRIVEIVPRKFCFFAQKVNDKVHGARVGMNYASCSPFRVPIARLAAAQAAIEDKCK